MTVSQLQSSPGQLKYVKKLKVEWIGNKIGIHRLVTLIQIFSGIEELELSSGGRWDDAAIQLLVLWNLRKINIGENKLLSDQALVSLANNCRNLQHFILDGCSGMSPEGLCGFIHEFPNLHTLHLPVFSKVFTQTGFIQLGSSIGNLKLLFRLSICDHMVNDNVLKAIGRFELPLMSLEVKKVGTSGLYTMKGLGALLNAARNLTVLKVSLPELDLGNQDREMSQLVKLLSHLKHILIQTRNWFHETLFSLIDNCHKLEDIIILGDNGKCGSDIHVTPPKKKNVSVEYICIKPRLDDSLRTTLQSSCPCLKWLKSS